VARSKGGLKQTTLYKKTVSFDFYGNDPEELKAVAAHARKTVPSHPLCIGGKKKRKVSVHGSESNTPTKVFDGLVG